MRPEIAHPHARSGGSGAGFRHGERGVDQMRHFELVAAADDLVEQAALGGFHGQPGAAVVLTARVGDERGRTVGQSPVVVQHGLQRRRVRPRAGGQAQHQRGRTQLLVRCAQQRAELGSLQRLVGKEPLANLVAHGISPAPHPAPKRLRRISALLGGRDCPRGPRDPYPPPGARPRATAIRLPSEAHDDRSVAHLGARWRQFAFNHAL
jgi:hypothetical protein